MVVTLIGCPGRDELQQLLVGQVPSPRAEQLTDHLAECPRCDEAARMLTAEDPLLQTLRHPPEENEVERTIVANLIQRLRGLSSLGAEGTPPPADPEDGRDFLEPPAAPDEIGRFGPYRVLRVLGAGGMGVVFLAEDPPLRRLVCLKMPRPPRPCPALRQRFLREARAAAAVRHDHVVTIYHVGEQAGQPYLAMEYLDGETLDARLQREGRLPPAEVLRVGQEIADGLAAAHACGLVHRDIKPGNVFLEKTTGRVKILDFGLAHVAEDDARLTQVGVVVGTPMYMAPEQARGEPVDGRCDLFSLGCTLYQAAAGRPPFVTRNTVAALLSVASDTPRPPDDLDTRIPPALSELIMKLLAKDPADRPASAQQVKEALRAIDPDARAPRGGRWSRGRRWLLAAGLAGVAALVGILLAQIGGGDEPANQPGDFSVDFRGKTHIPPGFGRTGPGAMTRIRPGPEGVRITIPATGKPQWPVGLVRGVRLSGDFEVTATYELLSATRPAQGVGSGPGFDMYLVTDTPNREAILLGRLVFAKEGDVYYGLLIKGPPSDRKYDGRVLPASESSGQLRMSRTGSTLTLAAAPAPG